MARNVAFVTVATLCIALGSCVSLPSVVINNPSCAPIVTRYINENRNVTAIELFIVASTCEGIVHPMDSGLGGGFQMVFHRSGVTDKAVYVDAREMSYSNWAKLPTVTGRTARHIGIPGMLRGYKHIYRGISRYYNGRVNASFTWKRLFEENSALAHEGFNISRTLSNVLMTLDIDQSPWRLNESKQTLRSQILGDYLDRIGKGKGDIYKHGDPDHRNMIAELRSMGSPITARDVRAYRVRERSAARVRCLGWTVFSSRLPGSGVLQLFGCKMLEHAIQRLDFAHWPEERRFIFLIRTLHYMYSIQPSLPYLYARRGALRRLLTRDARLAATSANAHWNDTLPVFIARKVGRTTLPTHQTRLTQHTRHMGTSNICAYDIHGGSLCATSTVNWGFGSGYSSRNMGFFYNNQLADFTYGNSRSYNRPRPLRRPMSSISPTIFVNSTTRRADFQFGAAGGRKIISSNFIVMARMIAKLHDTRELDCIQAEAYPRCVYHLKPFRQRIYTFLECEDSIAVDKKDSLHRRGAVVKYTMEAGYSSVTVLSRKKEGKCFDKRRGGAIV